MKQILLVVLGLIVHSLALDCNIHMGKDENLKNIVTKCVKTNRTFEDLWNMSPMSSESDSSSSEELHSETDLKMTEKYRTVRGIAQLRVDLVKPQMEEENISSTMRPDTQVPTILPEMNETVSESCVVQCIFSKLEMVDSNGFPLREKMVEGLLKNATGRELRDFIQDTMNECYQEMEILELPDSCVFSQKLIQCIAEKGKANCADWPIGELPFQS